MEFSIKGGRVSPQWPGFPLNYVDYIFVKNEDNIKMKTTGKIKMTPKMKGKSKMKMTSRMKTTLNRKMSSKWKTLCGPILHNFGCAGYGATDKLAVDRFGAHIIKERQ